MPHVERTIISLMLTNSQKIKTLASVALAIGLMLPLHIAFSKTFEYGGHTFNSNVALPKWVEEVHVPLEKYTQRPKQVDSVRYLLHDRQRSVVGRRQLSYYRIVMQPWSQDGLEDSSQVKFDFSPSYQKLNIYWVNVYRDGKLVSRFDPHAVKLIQQEKDIDKLQYDGTVTALAVLEDVRIGDVIDYAYSLDGHNPVMGDTYSARHRMAWGTPVDHLYLRLTIEKSRQLDIKYKDLAVKPRTDSRNGITTYTWDIREVAAVPHDGQVPPGFDPYPRIYISEYQNWRDVQRWAEALYVYEERLSPELGRLVDEFKRLPTKEKQARAALKFVQQEIRYFGVEMGQNSHRPSEPNKVVERRFGDCKDKALLMVAILRELGMDAWPALVSIDNNKGVKDWLPTPKAFDHVIVMLKLEGETYWLDGTRGYQAGRLTRIGLPDYGVALAIGKGRGLIPIEYGKENKPFIDVEEELFIKNYAGPVEMRVVSRYHTSRAEKERQYFLNNAHERIQDDYLDFYARKYPGISVKKPLEVHDDKEENILEVREYYLINNYFEQEESRLYATLRGTTLDSWLSYPDKVKRSMPMGINYPFKIKHISSITYPENIDFDIHDDVAEIEGPSFKFKRVADYQPNTLSVRFDLEATTDAVKASDVDSYMKKTRAAKNELYYSVWVREPGWMTSKRLASETDPMVDELVDRLSRRQ